MARIRKRKHRRRTHRRTRTTTRRKNTMKTFRRKINMVAEKKFYANSFSI